jgi:hypothetical protein
MYLSGHPDSALIRSLNDESAKSDFGHSIIGWKWTLAVCGFCCAFFVVRFCLCCAVFVVRFCLCCAVFVVRFCRCCAVFIVRFCPLLCVFIVRFYT